MGQKLCHVVSKGPNIPAFRSKSKVKSSLPVLTTIPELHFLTNRLKFLARWNYKSKVIRLN